MDYCLRFYLFSNFIYLLTLTTTSTTITTTISTDLSSLRSLDAQQDERVRLECTVTSKSDAEEAMWMRIRPPHNPDILTYRDSVVYAPERIQLEQRLLSSHLNENGTFTEIYYLTLTILRPNIDDEGRYVCSKHRKIFAEYDLYIIVPPQFIDEQSSIQQQTVLEGSTLQLTCSANGRPKPSITWFYRTTEGKHISLGNGKDCEDTICELRLGNYSRNDPTMIECVADNSKSTRISKIFTIDIHYPPKIITSVRAFTGSRSIEVFLQCSSIANPPGTIVWLDQEKQEIDNSNLYNIKTTDQSSTLSFAVFPQGHPSTVFYCRSNNSIGFDEKLINISDFIQFDAILIPETTTLSLSPSTTQDPPNNSQIKKQKTLRPNRARSRSSTIPALINGTSTSKMTSASNSFSYSCKFCLLSLFLLVCFLPVF